MELVKTKIPAKTKSTIPNVPEIVPVKYSTPIIAANITLIILSAEPMFLFIFINFKNYCIIAVQR